MTIKFQHEILTSAAPAIEVKATDQGMITGYGSIFGNRDRQGDVVLQGAFTKSLRRASETGEMPVMLWSHAQEQPIGRWTAMSEDKRGLRVEGQLNLKTDGGRAAFEHVRAGDVGGLSIGYVVPDGGRKYISKGTFEVSEVDLYEVSLVTVPANPAARIQGVKSLSSKSEAIDMLRECGLSRKAASRFAAGGWTALSANYDQTQIENFAAKIDRAIEQLRN